jgi:hypothetical protein
MVSSVTEAAFEYTDSISDWVLTKRRASKWQDPGHFLDKFRTFLVEAKNILIIIQIFKKLKICLCKWIVGPY